MTKQLPFQSNDDTSVCETEVTSGDVAPWQTPSAARARAISLVPDLATHEWRDTYFDKSEHDIIAVFDHDLELLALTNAETMSFLCSCNLPCYVFIFVVVALANWQALPTILGVFSPFIALHLYVYDQVRRSTSEHTALTSKGVLYIDEQRTLLFKCCFLHVQNLFTSQLLRLSTFYRESIRFPL